MSSASKVKPICFYLPQYYTFKENDEWWGEGFTEWVNVKKATKLFKWHYQPQIPLNGDYYELNNNHHETMEKQIEIAKKYGIYGFCFYHYWFENGKKLLEIPVEKFLEDKSLNIPFCLSWANEPWTRAWDGGNKEIIMHQEYGDQEEWEQHFYYLLPFFKDERYIKMNGKPLFVIYRVELIERINEMLGLWTDLARKEGLEGLEFVSQGAIYATTKDKTDLIEHYILYEPGYTQGSFSVRRTNLAKGFVNNPLLFINIQAQKMKLKIAEFLHVESAWWNTTILNYDLVWNDILNRTYTLPGIIPGAFPAWDNSARRGKKGARIIKGATPKKFRAYFEQLAQKTINETAQDFIFITAWNEWAEGAHLEPDEKYKYGYLEAIKAVVDKLDR